MEETVQGEVVYFDEQDSILFYSKRWFVKRNPSGSKYLKANFRTTDGKWVMVYFHTLILGKIYDGLVVDHKNGNGLDNRRKNLRYVTKSVNGINTKRLNIYYCNTFHKWVARAQIDYKVTALGYFKTLDEAKLAKQKFLDTHCEGAKLV